MNTGIINIDEGLLDSIGGSGHLKVSKLRSSREKLCMIYDVNTLAKVEVESLIRVRGSLTNRYEDVVLSDGGKILWVPEENGRSIILKDAVVQGCNKESPWVFMGKSLDIICVEEKFVVYNDGTFHDRPTRLAITENGEILLEDYRRLSQEDFIKRLIEQEILRGKIEINLEEGIAKAKNITCFCKPMENSRYVWLTVHAYKRGLVRKEYHAIYDIKNDVVLNNRVYEYIEKLQGIQGIFEGLYRGRRKTSDGYVNEIIDMKPLHTNEDDMCIMILKCKHFEVLDDYYICVSDADMTEVRNGRIMQGRDAIDIVKFDNIRRRLISVLNKSILDQSYNCCTRIRGNKIYIIKNNWDGTEICSVKIKDKQKDLGRLISEGDDVQAYVRNQAE